MTKVGYVIDSNFFISFHSDLLPPDIYPAFWDKLKAHYVKGNWLLLDCVKNEIEKGKDTLVDWIKDPCFTPLDTTEVQTINSYRMIMNDLQNNSQYSDEAKGKYAGCADSWIVAFAYANNFIIVTRETSKPKSKSNIKIPDIANHHGVKTMDVNTFMRQPDISFVFTET